MEKWAKRTSKDLERGNVLEGGQEKHIREDRDLAKVLVEKGEVLRLRVCRVRTRGIKMLRRAEGGGDANKR